MTTKSQTPNMVRFAQRSQVCTGQGQIMTVLTKNHDGLRLTNDLFNKMIQNFFTPPVHMITSIKQLPIGPNQLFRTRTDDLIRRLHSRGRPTPVLVSGSGCGKVTHQHAPYLKNLLSWLAKAVTTQEKRQWMVDTDLLLTQDGIVFVKDLVDGLV